MPMPNLEVFKERLLGSIQANLTAKELAQCVIIAALEAEYGHSFTMTPGFAKMVNTLAESIVTNPELRRHALAITSELIRGNTQNTIKERV